MRLALQEAQVAVEVAHDRCVMALGALNPITLDQLVVREMLARHIASVTKENRHEG